MTSSTTTRRWDYVGDGVQDTFAYNNRITAKSDLLVYLELIASPYTPTLKTLTTDYDVTGVGADAGGNVVFGTPPADTVNVVIVSKIPATQPSTLKARRPLTDDELERAIDRIAYQVQQLAADYDRSPFRLGAGDSVSPAGPPAWRTFYNKVVVVGAAGALEPSSLDAATIESGAAEAAASAAAAAASQSAAAASATAAAASEMAAAAAQTAAETAQAGAETAQTGAEAAEAGAAAAVAAAIGVSVQAWSAKLDTVAAMTWAANKGLYFTSASAAATYDLSSFGRTLGGYADEAAFKAGVNLEIGVDVQAYDADTAKLDVADQVITGGARVTANSLGTISSGTVTPDPGDRPHQYYTNNGAHTLAPGTNEGSYLLLITNGAAAGPITTSGWTKKAGDSFDTTNTNKFLCHCSILNGASTLIVQALQ